MIDRVDDKFLSQFEREVIRDLDPIKQVMVKELRKVLSGFLDKEFKDFTKVLGKVLDAYLKDVQKQFGGNLDSNVLFNFGDDALGSLASNLADEFTQGGGSLSPNNVGNIIFNGASNTSSQNTEFGKFRTSRTQSAADLLNQINSGKRNL